MWGLLASLTGLGGAIRDITTSITNLQTAKLKASTDVERMTYDQQINEAHDRRLVLISLAHDRLTSVMRFFIAFGPGSYVFKYYFYDKVIGSLYGCAAGMDRDLRGRIVDRCATFVTDGLSDQMAAVLTAVIAFYFAYDIWAKSRKPRTP